MILQMLSARLASLLRFALLALVFAAPATAAERVLMLTDFDRVRVDGAFTVTVVAGRGASGRATGTPAAVEAVRAEVQGRTLVIRSVETRSGPRIMTQAATIRLTVPVLMAAALSGSGSITVDTMRAARVDVGLQGSGRIDVARITADRTDLALVGSGSLQAAGTTNVLTAASRGSGTLDATRLLAADETLNAQGAGDVAIAARRSAKISATGSGSVTVAGKPACTVTRQGSGTVACGSDQP